MVSPAERVGSSDPARSGAEWPTRTLCGRPYLRIVTEPGLDLLGDDARRVCKSCWRMVERWLSPPPVAEGEADVLRWMVAAVLEIGEAMVEGVPVPRLESIWQKELHAAAERMWAIEAGEPVDAPRWRRRWEDITGIR
jgi:hypothetical protein